ncbi:hypothetical protein HPP92_022689 [Vanilla planifolia]|uniref:Protein kinase domain-containing protein n=1 Tax=Vanilla planifolia TaxID=51239 RepID=A0A835PSL7_VANPL|nr:hypothetical protein HPP92_022689 [Vanilla planifolia]
MDTDGCSCLIRTKVPPAVSFRPASTGLPSIKYEFTFAHAMSPSQTSSSSNWNLGVSESSFSTANSKLLPTRADEQSGKNLNDTSFGSSNTSACGLSNCVYNRSSLPTLMESDSPSVEFSFNPDGRTVLDPKKHKHSSSSSFAGLKKKKSKPKLRSVESVSAVVPSDVFAKAKSTVRRFSIQRLRQHQQEKKVSRKHHSSKELKTEKKYAKPKTKKDKPLARGGRVTALETTEKWVVDLSQLYFGDRFSFGAHSRLYRGMYKNQHVAVKVVRLPDVVDDESRALAARLEKQFVRERDFLSRLSHRNVIKLSGACEMSPFFFILTEYLSGGSLRSFVNKQELKNLSLDRLISIALDVARGMEYIHSQGVIHRDLKPENILFDKNMCAIIADFGVACEAAHCDALEDDAGTYRWMAPEMIKRKPSGRKVDVYGFGLLLWVMATGCLPYDDLTPVQAAFAVVNKSMRPVIPAECPEELGTLMEQCWSSNPEKRPEFWHIVKVLEQSESSLARDGTLHLPVSVTKVDHKRKPRKWIKMLRR